SGEGRAAGGRGEVPRRGPIGDAVHVLDGAALPVPQPPRTARRVPPAERHRPADDGTASGLRRAALDRVPAASSGHAFAYQRRNCGGAGFFFSTLTMLATPRHVTLQHPRIECFYPADAGTESTPQPLARV